jgi:hypothetical protein
MFEQEHHEMVLATTHASGAEEWFCPTCGRRFLLRWPPTYEKLIIESGDEHAAHSGSKGDMLRLGGLDITASEVRPADDDLFAPRREQLSDPVGELPPTITYAPEAEEVGDIPITDELQPWLKWLAGVDFGGPAGEPDQAAQ